MILNKYNCAECDSVKSFLDIVLNWTSDKELYFRGESKVHKYIVPNLYLKEELTKKASENYYKSLLSQLGRDEYSDSTSLFRTLSEFQHYGAKTRILDITTNPLVALYFAVEKFYGEDVPDVRINGKQVTYPCEPGIVYFFTANSNCVKYDTGHTVAIKSALNLMPQNVIDCFLLTCEKYKKMFENDWDDLKWHSMRGIYDRLSCRNLEISNPDQFHIGRFMDLLNQRAKCSERLIFPFEIYNDLCISHIVIPSKCTDRIKQQQGYFIFPKYPICDNKQMEDIQSEIDQSVSQLSAKVKMPQKRKNIIAIKIPGDKKEHIKNELSKLGINEGFIYPDIEHRSNALLNSKSLCDNNYASMIPVWK